MNKKIATLLTAFSLTVCTVEVKAQTWNMVGNTNLTASSKIGGTSATAAQNFPLQLWTYNAERIHINANVSGKVGYVGIGTAAPATRLHVNGVITATGGTSTDWNAVFTRVPAGTTSRVARWNGTAYVAGKIYDNNTNVGIGAINTGFAFNVNTPAGKSGINVTNGGITCANTIGNGMTCSGISYGVDATATDGNTAVRGTCTDGYGIAGFGFVGTYGSGSSYGAYGYSTGGYGVYGSGSTGVYGSGATGIYGSGTSYGVYGAATNNGVYGSGVNGIYGTGTSYGVLGQSTSNVGVGGTSSSYRGVEGISVNFQGGYFSSSANNGLWARTFSTAAGVYAGVFEGSVYTFGTYSASDGNLKKNIRDVDNALQIINKLQPKNYEFRNDGKYADMHLPAGNHFGLIAQEVEKVLPEIVGTAPHGLGEKATIPSGDPAKATEQSAVEANNLPDTKAINYTELIPIIIKAMQEQQEQITALKADNDQLKKDLQSCCLNNGSSSSQIRTGVDELKQPMLEQNSPNPFNTETVIHYYLPDNSSAVIKIISVDGKEMMTEVISKTGYGEMHISAAGLSAGTYTYTLIVNGKTVESKTMVLTR
ncbi:MAG: tail fiber domain-containing protein [Bacteroidota bacterium]